MKRRILQTGLPAAALALIGGAAIAWWFAGDPAGELHVHGPAMDDPDGRRAAEVRVRKPVGIGQYFERFDGVAGVIPGRWPHFRGPGYDNIRTNAVPLAGRWPTNGPPVLWSIELGEGHAGAAVANGRVYVLDYEEETERDALRCFSLADGREIWRRSYAVKVKRNHGMSRTVPAVTDRYAVSMGPLCHVMCVRSIFGDFLWGLDLVADYGTEVPGWYAGQCPLIEDGKAILAPAGANVLMMAVDCESGDTVWATPNPAGFKMSHSSITPMVLDGVRMYVYAALGGVAGVAADGPAAGRLLWWTDIWSPRVVVPSPVILDGGRIYLTAGYAAGGLMIRVVPDGETYRVEELYRCKPREGLASEQQTPLYYRDHLFGVMPKDGGRLRQQLVCFRPDGELVWASGRRERFGIGPYIVADGKLFVLDDNGEMTMAEAGLEAYRPLARARVLPGHDSWGPPALVSGRMIVRDSRTMVCLDLRRNAAGNAAGMAGKETR